MATALNGLILAGGHSTRMGQDKGALIYHGINHTQYLARLLTSYVENVFVSVRKDQTLAHAEGLQTLPDHYACPTPLNGIVSAMRQVPTHSWLVIAVDMPNIDKAAIEILIQHRNATAVATCFASPVKGGPDPLFAIWENHASKSLKSLITDNTEHVCPRGVLKKMNAHIIADTLPAHMLSNINTPEELAELSQQAS